MKKSILCVLLVAIFACTLLCSCKEETKDTEATPKTTIATTSSETKEPAKTSEIIDGKYTFDHVTLTLPEGFKIVENGGSVSAVPENAETSGDAVCFVKSSFDDIDSYDESVVEQQLKNSVSGFSELVRAEKVTVSEHDAIVCSYTANNGGTEIKAQRVVIFGSDYTDSIDFISATGVYDEAYSAGISSITVAD